MEPHSVPAWRGALAGSVGYNPLSTLQVGRTLRFERRRPQGNRQYDCARSPAFTKIVKTAGKFERLSEFELDQARPLLVALAESASDLLCRADSSASESPSRSRHLVAMIRTLLAVRALQALFPESFVAKRSTVKEPNACWADEMRGVQNASSDCHFERPAALFHRGLIFTTDGVWQTR